MLNGTTSGSYNTEKRTTAWFMNTDSNPSCSIIKRHSNRKVAGLEKTNASWTSVSKTTCCIEDLVKTSVKFSLASSLISRVPRFGPSGDMVPFSSHVVVDPVKRIGQPMLASGCEQIAASLENWNTESATLSLPKLIVQLTRSESWHLQG